MLYEKKSIYMKKIKRHNYLLLILLVSNLSAFSQNFHYSLTKDSSTYSELNNPKILSASENSQNKNFIIHLPFHFNFCGSVSDSITIESNGFIVFDKSKGLSSVAFNNYGSKKDSLGNFVSSISYLTEGGSGNRIIKLQFKDLAQSIFSSADYLSYQIWFYENPNKIEYHIGPNYASTIPKPVFPPEISEEERTLMEVKGTVLIGLINRNMDTTDKAYLIKGDPSSPLGQTITGETELVYINNIPNNGIVYTLTPTF